MMFQFHGDEEEGSEQVHNVPVLWDGEDSRICCSSRHCTRVHLEVSLEALRLLLCLSSQWFCAGKAADIQSFGQI